LSGFEQRIIIVGGGPSGMHMSACLAAKGYTKAGTKNLDPGVDEFIVDDLDQKT